MRLRHKQPTLVSMWMLDVFCCALGCVTLLWLLKTREAGLAANDVSQTSALLAEVRTQQDETAKQLALVTTQRDVAARELAVVRTERDETANKLALAQNAIRDAASELRTAKATIDAAAEEEARLKKKSAATAEELAKQTTEAEALTKKLTSAQAEADRLQATMRETARTQSDHEKQLAARTAQVIEAEAKLAASQAKLDTAAKSQTDLATANARATTLEKQLTQANVQIIDLQGVKAKLADQVDRLRVEADARFAGVTMSGKRVVFLVDISGSMERVDENTPDANKWPTVSATIVKVMKSLPTLEKFQVILFSSNVRYLIGTPGEWIDYDPKASANRLADALATVKPVGDTNLYSGMEEAFKFRASGLDAVYLFSDGLPTSGPGISSLQETAKLRDTERSDILGKHLRRTVKSVWNRSDSRTPVRINAIGFFYDSPDVGAFLWALSRENDGSFVGMSKP